MENFETRRTAEAEYVPEEVFIISTLFEDLAPGLNSLFTFYGHARSGSLEVQSIDEHVRVYASIDPMTANPTLYASGVVTSGMMGNTQVAVGAQASFNALTGSIIYYHAGVSYTQSDLNAVVTMLDKGETVTASYYHIINPLTNTVVGAEVDYFFPSKENLFVFGIQHALDPLTTVKACVDTIGIVDALVQHQWGVNSLITISCTLDSRDIANRTLFGLGLSLKP
ncbi:hypothetical protein LXL04_002769 [Taraxacum kok-saghyz]